MARDNIPNMQTLPESEVRRSVLRLAVAAALVAFLIPVLPLSGPFGGRFTYSLGSPQVLIAYLLVRSSSAIVVTMGIWFLRRDHLGIAGGIFAAVALFGTILVAEDVLITAPHFGREWPADVIIAIEIAETILLALAATRAIGASRSDTVT
jgi:hypothetical protein